MASGKSNGSYCRDCISHRCGPYLDHCCFAAARLERSVSVCRERRTSARDSNHDKELLADSQLIDISLTEGARPSSEAAAAGLGAKDHSYRLSEEALSLPAERDEALLQAMASIQQRAQVSGLRALA